MPILKPINNPGELAKVIKYCNADGIKHNKHDDTAGRIFVIKNCELLKELMICNDIYAKCDKFELDSIYY